MATVSTTPTSVDGDILYEVVNGEIVEIPPMGVYQGLIATLLSAALQNFATARHGRVTTEVLFDFSRAVGRKRRPDLAFVSYERWPREKQVPRTEAWDVVPNLAVEVVSPTNTVDDVLEKLFEYFQVGIERVWVVCPSQRQIYVYTSVTEVKVLSENDELADDALLPGFRLPLDTLFDDTAAGK